MSQLKSKLAGVERVLAKAKANLTATTNSVATLEASVFELRAILESEGSVTAGSSGRKSRTAVKKVGTAVRSTSRAAKATAKKAAVAAGKTKRASKVVSKATAKGVSKPATAKPAKPAKSDAK